MNRAGIDRSKEFDLESQSIRNGQSLKISPRGAEISTSHHLVKRDSSCTNHRHHSHRFSHLGITMTSASALFPSSRNYLAQCHRLTVNYCQRSEARVTYDDDDGVTA